MELSKQVVETLSATYSMDDSTFKKLVQAAFVAAAQTASKEEEQKLTCAFVFAFVCFLL
jgi:hypothetical protein